MNKRSSIYLTDELRARVEASGLSLRALVVRGLDSMETRRRDEIKAVIGEIRELRNEVRAALMRRPT